MAPSSAPAVAPPPLPDGARSVASRRDRASDSDLAQFQVSEQTRTYPCKQCGSQLRFDPAAQCLLCPSCGAKFEIVIDKSRHMVEHDLASTMRDLRQVMAAANAQPQLTGKEIVCQNCGGHTVFSGSITATKCPYCATPIQRDDVQNAPARLPIDGVLPFQVSEDVGRKVIEEWINNRWFAPNEFKKYRELGSFTSIYASYFTYDADTETEYSGQRGDTYTVVVGNGDNQRTETRVRWSYRAGVVRNNFDDIAELANTGFDAKRVRDLEPWPTQNATPYTPEFLAGHMARTYDNDAGEVLPAAKSRMEAEIELTVRSDIGGDQQRISQLSTAWHSLSYKYVLLPIWLLTVIYQGQAFQVFINGITGEVQGDRPYSKIKIAFATVIAIIIVIAAFIVFRKVRSV